MAVPRRRVRYGGRVNRLAGSASSYLQEHADNPVDWYPWGPEAFARARELDRPILVSIGYAACHWCHVMARESFEDPEIARHQNALFVSVKVDREERPDVDAVYMDAVQALTGRGGWPMTVFCLPDGRPFHAGTYYPPRDRDGMAGFPRVLDAVSTAYAERRAEVERAAADLTRALTPARLTTPAAPAPPFSDAAAARLLEQVDGVHGGFGGAPKFPNAPALGFLLGRSAAAPPAAATTDRPSPASAVLQALDAMARGGIHDQVGGGFHRYTVDAAWRIPHFEKMLVDQAQLVSLYAAAHRRFGRPADRRVVADTIDHVLADLAVADGGFAASSDADSEGEEGRFFVWTRAQLSRALGADDGALAALVFGVDAAGNFEGGTTVLHLPRPLAEVAAGLGGTPEELEGRVDRWRARLREVRRRRAPPRLDGARLTGWNALAATALLDAGAVLGRPDHRQRGLETLAMVLERSRTDGRLRHVWHRGAPLVDASLTDVAALGLACIAAHQATLDGAWLETAGWVAEAVLPRYRDPHGPGWFDAPEDHDVQLPVRPRSLEDGSVPSGTALAALFALRAGALCGDSGLLAAAGAVLGALAPTAVRVPLAFGGLLLAADEAAAGPVTVAVVGGAAADRAALLGVVRERYRPHVLCLTDPGPATGRLHPALAAAPPGRAVAVVCRDSRCGLPQSDPAQLRVELAFA